jgi:hypothetical protein
MKTTPPRLDVISGVNVSCVEIERIKMAELYSQKFCRKILRNLVVLAEKNCSAYLPV